MGSKTRLPFKAGWLLVLLIVAPAAGAADTRHLQGLGDPVYHHLESQLLGRGFHIYIAVPPGYETKPDRRYPAVYVLDGGGLFPMLTAYHRYLVFGSEVPEVVIVGISYGAFEFREGNYRSTDYTAPSAERDYWGGAAKFQRFLGQELLPLIESQYPVRPDRRIIFGQSIGGQFVLFTAQTRPGLFWGHIASNPALHRNLEFFLTSVPERARNAKLFVGGGTLDDPRFRQPRLAWSEHWLRLAERPWELMTVDLAGHTHMSAPPAIFRRGMIWLFSGKMVAEDND